MANQSKVHHQVRSVATTTREHWRRHSIISASTLVAGHFMGSFILSGVVSGTALHHRGKRTCETDTYGARYTSTVASDFNIIVNTTVNSEEIACDR
jgi:hypothetical protein